VAITQPGLINPVVGHAGKIHQRQIKDVDELRERTLAAMDEMNQQFMNTASRQCSTALSTCQGKIRTAGTQSVLTMCD